MENTKRGDFVKKIGIYNPYLETKGGGEKLCLALAETLAAREDTAVSLITHSEIDIDSLARYFDLDLDRINLHVVNFKSFGTKIFMRLPLPGAIKYLFNDVKIFRAVKSRGYDLFINNCYQSNLPAPSPTNVYLCMFPQQIKYNDDIRGRLHGIYRTIIGFIYKMLLHPTKKHAVYTYDKVVSISAYTQKYVKKYWGLESDLLYPVCDNMHLAGVNKQKKILNVGRFFQKDDVSHHKRHDFLIDAFSKMKELQKQGWELHIVGSVAEDSETLKYVISLLKACSGLPIYLHFNASFEELKRLYNEATIYWHATGYGSNAKRYPEKQEHFGISTVEAMSTGCVPVVIDTAGQKELINQGSNGFLWASEAELASSSLKIAEMNESEIAKLAEAAKETTHKFDKQAFAKRVETIF